jgi:hypothetical protein
MISSLQCAISLGRFDIQTETMTMSHFRTAPMKGHLKSLKRMYGYLRRFKSAAIRVCIDELDLPPCAGVLLVRYIIWQCTRRYCKGYT